MANIHQHIPSASRSIRLLSLLTGGLLLLSGCIKEDLSDCPEPGQGIILRYRYDLNMDYADKFAERVENLQAFIFDQAGILRDTLTPPAAKGTIVPGWERRVNLAPGTYSILTWAGSDKYCEHFFTAPGHYNTPDFSRKVEIGQTSLTEMRMYLKCNYPVDKQTSGSTPYAAEIRDLYHGLVKNVTVNPEGFTAVTTPLVKNTNTIRIRIEGLSHLGTGVNPDDFELSIAGRNSHYKFDNMIGEEARDLTYTPYNRAVEGDVLSANIKTLRLMKPDTDPHGCCLLQLNIAYKPTGLSICKDINLVDLILSGRIPARDAQGKLILDDKGQQVYTVPTLEYLDRQDIFDLKFEISKSPDGPNLIVTIYINDWKITNIYPV